LSQLLNRPFKSITGAALDRFIDEQRLLTEETAARRFTCRQSWFQPWRISFGERG
jgi:hypothetical protein